MEKTSYQNIRNTLKHIFKYKMATNSSTDVPICKVFYKKLSWISNELNNFFFAFRFLCRSSDICFRTLFYTFYSSLTKYPFIFFHKKKQIENIYIVILFPYPTSFPAGWIMDSRKFSNSIDRWFLLIFFVRCKLQTRWKFSLIFY